MKDQLLDLSYISITTCSGDTYAKIEPSSPNLLETLKDQKLKIEARTIYELDADIIKILPINNNNGKAEIDQEILKLHKESELLAIDNWNKFVNTVLDVTKTILAISGAKIDAGFHYHQTSARIFTCVKRSRKSIIKIKALSSCYYLLLKIPILRYI